MCVHTPTVRYLHTSSRRGRGRESLLLEIWQFVAFAHRQPRTTEVLIWFWPVIWLLSGVTWSDNRHSAAPTKYLPGTLGCTIRQTQKVLVNGKPCLVASCIQHGSCSRTSGSRPSTTWRAPRTAISHDASSSSMAIGGARIASMFRCHHTFHTKPPGTISGRPSSMAEMASMTCAAGGAA